MRLYPGDGAKNPDSKIYSTIFADAQVEVFKRRGQGKPTRHYINMSSPSFTFFNYPGTEANSESFHYSQAVKVGNIIETSGQGGWTQDGSIPSDLEKQVALAFENVENVLKAIDT
ncbi:hypothetical protein BDW75DRAFT_245995 [Aspergillus navahoensis]